jgi:hypothetical protein
MHPEVSSHTIGRPERLVRVNRAVAAGELLRNVVDNGLCFLRQHRFKPDQRSGRERDAMHLFDDLRAGTDANALVGGS